MYDGGKLDNKIGHTILISIALLIFVPLTTGYVSCRLACRRCDQHKYHPSILEIYCAMCDECRQRRQEMARHNLKIGENSEGAERVEVSSDETSETGGHSQATTVSQRSASNLRNSESMFSI
ncbi:uncharacterized protein LOC142978452 isoform X2 [Anticarsia gemmatalis]|uniref:uncharacterized protein LOC142978452 isoform X2 n=1 Tax=Anticarsia gemmatalis TaxID=129554 RepID=UPI003F76EB4F